jgi:hypothetical protein
MGRRSERRYERVERYPLGRAPQASWYDDELSEVRRTPMYGYDRASFDDFEEPRGVPRRRFRQVAWRFVGAAAIGGALYGVGQIGVHPEARREIVQWVTLGHAERIAPVERAVGGWIDRVRNW